MKEEIEKELKCKWCGYNFKEFEDVDDYKNIKDTGECVGCFNTED
jgi:hypothetical protein